MNPSQSRPMYLLKLNKSSNLLRPQISYYSQGISAQCIAFTNVTHWSIEKILFINGKPVSFSLNSKFIELQRRIKHYCKFLRYVRSLRFIQTREISGKTYKYRYD